MIGDDPIPNRSSEVPERVKRETTHSTPSLQQSTKSPSYDGKEFLDRHFQKNRIGVHHIPYTFDEIKHVTQEASKIVAKEHAFIEIIGPVTVVGDIHGQFNDLITIFLKNGRPPEQRFLFLGDYVDRGSMSVECIMLLLAYKMEYPDHVYLLRGNHELARINKKYGFYDSCLQLKNQGMDGEQIWAMFQRTFNQMSLCAIINGKIMCMHGGLSPELDSISDLRKMTKPIRNPFRGLQNDLMWADPDTIQAEWRNSSRGSGFRFGTKVIEEIMDDLNLELIIRAHQMCFDGYSLEHNRRVLTIFSAPSYCGTYQNAGCVVRVSDKLECQLVAFVPGDKTTKERLERTNRLWHPSLETSLVIEPGRRTMPC